MAKKGPICPEPCPVLTRTGTWLSGKGVVVEGGDVSITVRGNCEDNGRMLGDEVGESLDDLRAYIKTNAVSL